MKRLDSLTDAGYNAEFYKVGPKYGCRIKTGAGYVLESAVGDSSSDAFKKVFYAILERQEGIVQTSEGKLSEEKVCLEKLKEIHEMQMPGCKPPKKERESDPRD